MGEGWVGVSPEPRSTSTVTPPLSLPIKGRGIDVRLLRPRPIAAAGTASGIPLRPARVAISGAAECGRRATERRLTGRDGDPQRPRTLDLSRPRRLQRPHRAAAG